jgi:hypothetical protein
VYSVPEMWPGGVGARHGLARAVGLRQGDGEILQEPERLHADKDP